MSFLVRFNVFAILVLIFPYELFAQEVFVYEENTKGGYIGNYAMLYKDSTSLLSVNDVLNQNLDFIPFERITPNLGITEYVCWVKFTIENRSDKEQIFLEYAYPILDDVQFYSVEEEEPVLISKLGNLYPFYPRMIEVPNYVFPLNVDEGAKKTFLLRIESDEQIMLPIYMGSRYEITRNNIEKSIGFGFYAGIIIVMFLYNLFIFFSVRDVSYFYYVLHTFFIGLTQISFHGYTFQYLWSDIPFWTEKSIFILSCLVSIAGIGFLVVFLELKRYLPVMYKAFIMYIYLYLGLIFLEFLDFGTLSYELLPFVQILISVLILITSVILIKRGVRQAKFYLFAWSILFIGIIVFLLKDIGVLPYNNLTVYMMPVGSILEVVLLSFALADRINIMRSEKEKAQEGEIQAVIEMRDMAEDHAKTLQSKVDKATLKLKKSQGELVQSEKMNSLGRMAAGVAHEINNSINISNMNISVIERNVGFIRDYLNKIEKIDLDIENVESRLTEAVGVDKEMKINEIFEELVSAISNAGYGIKRTVEITAGLRYFSKIDTNTELINTNINKDLSSMVILQRALLSEDIQIKLDLGELPDIFCEAKSLNMAFLSIFENAVQAIKDKETKDVEAKGLIKIKTRLVDNCIHISFYDNGIGIDTDVLPQIFEPLFTTRGVAYRGLGLSSAYGAVKNHHGEINVHSSKGKGAIFNITLPI